MIIVSDVTGQLVEATYGNAQQAAILALPAYADRRIYLVSAPVQQLDPMPTAGFTWLNEPVSLAEYASDARWRREVGGTVWNGWPVATDDRSKTLVQGELAAIDMGVRADGEPFKFSDDVPRPLTNDQIKAVAVAMRAHVKATFGALFSVIAGIQAGTVATTADVDAALDRAMTGV